MQVSISANPPVSPADEMAASTETLSWHRRCSGVVLVLSVAKTESRTQTSIFEGPKAGNN
jgi:hypothetical protein